MKFILGSHESLSRISFAASRGGGEEQPLDDQEEKSHPGDFAKRRKGMEKILSPLADNQIEYCAQASNWTTSV